MVQYYLGVERHSADSDALAIDMKNSCQLNFAGHSGIANSNHILKLVFPSSFVK